MTEWEIQSRSNACTACGQGFADKTVYHTLLRFGAGGYQRQDLCDGCFKMVGREGSVSYWQGEYKSPPPAAPEPIQKETAETLLRKLIESPDPAQGPVRYILAVMLERKRILRHRDTVRDENGAERLVYEHVRTGESFTIPDPQLRLDQLADVQQQVSALLAPKNETAGTDAPAPAVSDQSAVN